ncbi:MAG: endonuclease/exonuclease/phosphatase family protein [Pseudobacter sp.]|uniref:endonuclease/exonuclease/phosphatase family protein n=1 Tax=Pseudobacter sp. TaxID=2045420 RepID=UPI003F7D7FB4
MQGCTSQQRAAPDPERHAPAFVKRFLTYNVLTGFQKNPLQSDKFIEWAKDKNFDVIAFQELSTFTQDSLERFARRYGHHFAILNKGNGSPIGITSKYPFTNTERISGNMHHGCIYTQTGNVHFFVTHLNPFSYEKCVEEMKGIIARAAAIPATEKLLIAGDLNSFSPADSLNYPGKRRYGVVHSLLDADFTDVFRQFHHQFEFSFPTTTYQYKVKTPARIDYVFANKTALSELTAAEIIRDSITDGLSDHYPILAVFK